MTTKGWETRRANGNTAPWNKGRKCPETTGPNNVRYNRVDKTCAVCGASFTVKGYRINTARFCSPPCAWQFRDEGKRTEHKKIRQSAAYRSWRSAVFERDQYTCVQCGDHNYVGRGKTVELHADHIKPFALHPELRFDIDNGRTLCLSCHRATSTWGRGALYRCVASA